MKNISSKKQKPPIIATQFQQRVYELCEGIPQGKVTTYKEIGNILGGKGQIYRAVGAALHRNPFAPYVPCHRVVASDGHIGGFAHGTKKKIEMLKKENIIVKNGRIVDFAEKLFRFL